MKTQLINEPVPMTHHCITGSIWRISQLQGSPISEDMLLGMGSGVGFVYWHASGADPFLGGRANVGRSGEEGLEKAIARSCGAKLFTLKTSSNKKAQNQLLNDLRTGFPVALQVDMGYLPYFNFPEEFHFGGHAVTAVGYDDKTGQICLADREEKLYWVDYANLEKARSSKAPPFSPGNAAWTWDFRNSFLPSPETLKQAIKKSAMIMLNPPIQNLGVKGIRTAAKRMATWQESMTTQQLNNAIFNLYIFIDSAGGTGGGLFRYMYSRFLREAATIIKDDRYLSLADDFWRVGDLWQEIALSGKTYLRGSDPDRLLKETNARLLHIADLENLLWAKLLSVSE